ncbi:protein kinase [Micrococcales bacterium 31B]|nr:protein kinase [Micrococcales bacterium 31B]
MIEDRYRLVSLIAVGGMGQVWRAWDTTLSREVAIKILREEFTGDEGYLERFKAEARHTAALSNENIASLFSYGEIGGTAYLVMELVPGVPLADLIEENPTGMPIDQCITILMQVGRALQAAHAKGVVHRDVKPENILVDDDDTVKITDFGIARSENEAKLTKTGLVMGTAQYLSPEQAMGKPASALSDIYSLGIVAFEMLSGTRPFTGETQVDIAMAQVKEPVPPLPPRVQPDLRDLVLKILSKTPMERPRSAMSVVRALEAIRRGERPAITAENLVLDGAGAEAAQAATAETPKVTSDPASPLDRAPVAPPVSLASTAREEGSAMPLPAPMIQPVPSDGPTVVRERTVTSTIPAQDAAGPAGTVTGQRRRGLGLPSIALILLILLAALGGILVLVDRMNQSDSEPTGTTLTATAPATGAATSAPTSSAPPTTSASASPNTVGPTSASGSSAVATGSTTVVVEGNQYVGRDAQVVINRLAALGFGVSYTSVPAVAGRPAGTVTSIKPTGQVPAGSTIAIEYTQTAGTPTLPRTTTATRPTGDDTTSTGESETPSGGTPSPGGSGSPSNSTTPEPTTSTSPSPTTTSPSAGPTTTSPGATTTTTPGDTTTPSGGSGQ